jgi:hypothetical protein
LLFPHNPKGEKHMAHENTTIDESHDESVRGFHDWTGTEATLNYAYLLMICQSFQNKMKAYYKAGRTDREKLKRLEEIRQKLMGIVCTDKWSEIKYTIAPTDGPTGLGCPGGGKYVGGACVDS